MSLLKKAVLIILLALAAMMPCMADSYTLSTRINNVNWLGGFGWGKERFVLLRAEMDNRINGSLKDLVCPIKNIGKHVQNMSTRS